MKKVILTFGIISGAIVSVMLFITMPLYKSGALNLDNGAVIGYTTMIVASSMIFIGVKSYRDNHLHGSIKFGKALQVGVLIAGVASIMYAVAWEVDLHFFFPDFMDMYGRIMITKAEKSGASPEKLMEIRENLVMMQGIYKNPLARFGLTLLEIFPIGLIISLISAAVLRKKEVLPV
jgi:Protein of unknown function (DUF4199)